MEASIHVWSLGKWLGFLCRLFVAVFRKKAESRSDGSVQAEQTAERLLKEYSGCGRYFAGDADQIPAERACL